MILIFAVDNNWNIGVDGKILVHIKQDLKRFKELTDGNIVIMGRRTLEAGPHGMPLEGRTNIIFTSQNLNFDNSYIVRSVEELDKVLEDINKDGSKEVFVSGGQTIVEQLIDRCEKAYITKIFKSFDRADTSFPNLDEDEDWEIVWKSDIYNEDGLDFQYVDYERKKD